MLAKLVFIVEAILLILMDGFFCFSSFKKKNNNGVYLGRASIVALIIAVAYLFSIAIDNELAASIFTSIYAFGGDLFIYILYKMALYLVDSKKKLFFTFDIIFLALIFLDFAIFAINPFNPFAISFTRNSSGEYPIFISSFHSAYYFHLAFTYLVSIVVIAIYAFKALNSPKTYRNSYIYMSLIIAVIVLLDAIYSFIPKVNVFLMFDWAIVACTFAIAFIYFVQFIYSETGVLEKYKSYIFESIDNGIIMFDFGDEMLIHNKKAEELLIGVDLSKKPRFKEFISKCEISFYNTNANAYSIQFYINDGDKTIPLRCDYRRLDDKKGNPIGKLLVITDARLETDILTGFQRWDFFEKLSANPKLHLSNSTVVLLDVNKLSLINETYGHGYGDNVLKTLSDAMRNYLPRGTYFVRGREAGLFAIMHGHTQNEIINMIEKIKKDEDQISFEYAISAVENYDKSIIDAVRRANNGLMSKKILNKDSNKNKTLASLIRALEECDSDTRAHVERTTKLGDALGKKINLSDVELSDLRLLAILHDIGKIGIPLEILNKPAKLTPEEFEIIKTHTVKGYNIAKSSPDLAHLANDILHHHERWDGKGYPNGLRMESIPLLSRIISVVDSYDAMRSPRPYKEAFSMEYASNELKTCAGKQFDPYIVNEFLSIMDEFSYLYSNVNEPCEDTDGGFIKIEQEISETQSVHPVNYSKIIIDPNNNIVSIDDHFKDIVGYTKEDIVNNQLSLYKIIPEAERSDFVTLAHQQLANSGSFLFEHKLLKKDGTSVSIVCFGRNYFDSVTKLERTEITIFNPTSTHLFADLVRQEESKLNEVLTAWEKTYRYESLTGLLSNKTFKSEINLMILDEKYQTLLVMVDLDEFKKFNDTYGHPKGDEYLIFVAELLKNAVEGNGVASRIGGDEFAIAMKFDKKISRDEIEQKTQAIFDFIAKEIHAKYNTTLSMGACLTDNEHVTFSDLYRKSDKCLYKSKGNGGGTLTF